MSLAVCACSYNALLSFTWHKTLSPKPSKHRNDIYGDIDQRETTHEAIPAATVVLLRDKNLSTELLMLRKNSRIAFGGMWVFPGGRIDDEDYDASRDLEVAARQAAVRESNEEANISLSSDEFHWFAHWTPPASTPVRYATWFFLANVPEGLEQVKVDGGEITDHAWISPRVAMERHAKEEIDLAPPTWVTLYHLSKFNSAKDIIDHFADRQPRYYETHLGKQADGTRVAMWSGDSGYEEYLADSNGDTHRLVMKPGGFEFLHSALTY